MSHLALAGQVADLVSFLAAARVLGLGGESNPLMAAASTPELLVAKVAGIVAILAGARVLEGRGMGRVAVAVLAIAAVLGWFGALTNLAALGVLS